MTVTNRDLTLLYITAYEGLGGWRRNSGETDRAVKKIIEDIVEREIQARKDRPTRLNRRGGGKHRFSTD